MALPNPDGAISNSKETSDRLLKVRHKIKNQILLEKLSCNRHSAVLCISCQWSLSNDPKNLSAQKKSSLPSEMPQHLWQMSDASVLRRKLLLIRGVDHKSQARGGKGCVYLESWVTVWLNVLSGKRNPVLPIRTSICDKYLEQDWTGPRLAAFHLSLPWTFANLCIIALNQFNSEDK